MSRSFIFIHLFFIHVIIVIGRIFVLSITKVIILNWNYHIIIFLCRAYFNHLLHVVPARSTLFEKRNAFFSNKTSKALCMPFYWTFLPFFGYTARMPVFSRISPVMFIFISLNRVFIIS